ncbi:hypothetical protein HAN_1g60 (nucleomorph) [Hemiselmis andersenii]|uniref:Uncharacterized protein n=1 Tax=Hemiselmis andersenii TaxID=464988 RepID=A9BK72_HEMAN|nr:hypothetical protein HAN_1g60 [Hemiselmis andersenii]ABW97905.1 hypothetical protein HAN_1g60 [Hemiselmis andersenii]
MKVLLYSSIRLGRLLKIITDSKAKKDSISFFFNNRFFICPLESGSLKLFLNSKKYFCSFVGLKKNLGIFKKSKTFLEKNYSLNSYIFVYDFFIEAKKKEKILTEKKIVKRKTKFPKSIEKSLVYLLDRKRKIFF